MKRNFRPLFLAPRSYRVRRMHDALRLLPFVGGFLVVLPLLWAPPAGQDRNLAGDAIYIFAVWFVVVVLAAFMSRLLGKDRLAEDPALAEPKG